MGDAGRARVEREFLIGHYVAAFERTYAELLARPAASYGWLGAWTWPSLYWKAIGGAVGRRVLRRRRPAPARRSE
jgi:hypothetical protein